MEFRPGGDRGAHFFAPRIPGHPAGDSGEMLLLRTRQPALMLQALARIFRGSAPRAAAAFVGADAGPDAGVDRARVRRAVPLMLKTLLEYFRAAAAKHAPETSCRSRPPQD